MPVTSLGLTRMTHRTHRNAYLMFTALLGRIPLRNSETEERHRTGVGKGTQACHLPSAWALSEALALGFLLRLKIPTSNHMVGSCLP